MLLVMPGPIITHRYAIRLQSLRSNCAAMVMKLWCLPIAMPLSTVKLRILLGSGGLAKMPTCSSAVQAVGLCWVALSPLPNSRHLRRCQMAVEHVDVALMRAQQEPLWNRE